MSTRRVPGFIGCGSVVLTVLLVTQGWAVPEQMRLMKEMENSQKQESPQVPAVEVPQIPYKAAGLREPFKPAYKDRDASSLQPLIPGQTPEEVVTAPALIISGLMWGGSIPQAVINGKVARVGDTVAGAEIIHIDQTGILISFKEKLFTISSPAAASAESSKRTRQGGTQ